MIGIGIKFGFDELPGEGELCTKCNEPITGTKYVPFVQIASPENAGHMKPLCETCYKDFWIEE